MRDYFAGMMITMSLAAENADELFVADATPDGAAVVLTTTLAGASMHIGNDLSAAAEPTGAGLCIRDNKVSVGTTVQASGGALTVEGGIWGLWPSAQQPFARMHEGALCMYDRDGGAPRVFVDANVGVVRSATGVFNAVHTLDVSGGGGYSVCRVSRFDRVSAETVRLVVNNIGRVSVGDTLLFDDAHVLLVLEVLAGESSDGPGAVVLLCYQIMMEDDVFRDTMQSDGVAAMGHSVFKLSNILKQGLPKRVNVIHLENAAYEYSVDGSVLRVSGDTAMKTRMMQLSDEVVGVSHDGRGVSFVVGRVSSVEPEFGTIRYAVTLTVDESFVRLPPGGTDLYLYTRVVDLVDKSARYQTLPVDEVLVAVDAQGMVLDVRFQEGTPGVVLDRVARVASSIAIGSAEYSLGPETAVLVDHGDARVVFRPEVSRDAPWYVGAGALQVGLITDFVGFRVDILAQTRLGGALCEVVAWKLGRTHLSHMLLAQFDGGHAVVLDGDASYVVFVAKVVSASTMLVQLSRPWEVPSHAGARSVYLYPVSLSQSYEFRENVQVPSLEALEDVSCTNFYCASNAAVVGSLELGDLTQGQPTMSVGYAPQTRDFVLGMDSFVQYKNVAESNAFVHVGHPLRVQVSGEVPPLSVIGRSADGVSVYADGSILCVGGVHVPSDKRTKTDIAPLRPSDAMRCVRGVQVSSYTSMAGTREVGVMAQDLLGAGVSRHAVSRHPTGLLTVRHDMLGSISFAAIKHLECRLRFLLGGKKKRRART